MLKETQLKVFQEELLCDDCGERVTMSKSIHIGLDDKPFQYFYKCGNLNCNNTREVVSEHRYPRLIYKIME